MNFKAFFLATIVATGFTQISFANDPQKPANDEQNIPGVAAQPDSYFFTGKPYDKELGGYVFAARTYDPEFCRWTTPDPSGFPDGPNNRIYAPVPTIQLDLEGLLTVSGQTTPNLQTTSTSVNGTTYTISVTAATQISASQFNISSATNFGTFANGYSFESEASSAVLNISNYSAYTDGTFGGVTININVSDSILGGHWIQIVTTNTAPGAVGQSFAANESFIDNGGADTPFYDTIGAGNSTYFSDLPRRFLTDASSSNSVTWSADLYYVSNNGITDGVDSISVYGGIQYSWTMTAE